MFNAVPHIGISIVKPVWDAVTVSAVAPTAGAGMLSVGVRPPKYRNGATACLAVSDGRGSPVQLEGDVLVADHGDEGVIPISVGV